MAAAGSGQQADVVEQVETTAPRARVWAAVSDPASYGRWSPEARGIKRLDGADGDPWQIGQRFLGLNRIHLPWFTVCRVVAADEGDADHPGVFAFDVDLGPVPVARWSYTVEDLPDGGGVRITEAWKDRRTNGLVAWAGVPVGRGRDAAARNRTTMRATLDALAADLA